VGVLPATASGGERQGRATSCSDRTLSAGSLRLCRAAALRSLGNRRCAGCVSVCLVALTERWNLCQGGLVAGLACRSSSFGAKPQAAASGRPGPGHVSKRLRFRPIVAWSLQQPGRPAAIRWGCNRRSGQASNRAAACLLDGHCTARLNRRYASRGRPGFQACRPPGAASAGA